MAGFKETFDDSKQFFLPDGRAYETVPMRECAIHHDDRILKDLAKHVIIQAVQDWHKLNKGGRKDWCYGEGSSVVWRHELVRFFNGSFCCDLLELLMPDVTQQEAIRKMNSMDFSRRQIGMGMGKLKDYGYNPRKGKK